MADDKSEPPTGPMNEHAARAYLELCRESILDQERTYRQCDSKAIGIITFGLVLLGIGGQWISQWISQQEDGSLGTVILVIMSLCVIAIAILTLGVILRPSESSTLEYNLDFAENDARHTASGKAVGATLIDFAEYYRLRIDYNKPYLYRRMGAVRWIGWFAVVEVLSFALFMMLLQLS